MSTYDLNKLRTVHLVPLTAYDSQGNLALDVQATHIRKMYAAGIRVYMPAAGTSEFHNLSADEVISLVRVTRESSGPDAQIFAPVGFQLSHAIEIGKRCRDAGATGIMFMPFAHPYMSDAGARDYYLQVIDQVGLPTLIYKKSAIPSDSLLLEMATNPHVVGVKYAENNMHDFRKVVMADRAGIEWLCGSAERFAPYYMLAGAHGYTTGAGNLCPHITLAMHDAFMAGQYEEGMRLQSILLPIEDYRARAGDSFNVSMLKHAMHLVGLEFGPARSPQRQISDAEKAEIDAMMQPILAAEAEFSAELTSVGLSQSGS